MGGPSNSNYDSICCFSTVYCKRIYIMVVLSGNFCNFLFVNSHSRVYCSNLQQLDLGKQPSYVYAVASCSLESMCSTSPAVLNWICNLLCWVAIRETQLCSCTHFLLIIVTILEFMRIFGDCPGTCAENTTVQFASFRLQTYLYFPLKANWLCTGSTHFKLACALLAVLSS
jgi:hypothetical protein